jgi:hypothetical protein
MAPLDRVKLTIVVVFWGWLASLIIREWWT